VKNSVRAGLVVLLIAVASQIAAAADQGFLGRWALTLPDGAGWLEVRQEQGYLDADILWYGGSVLPVDNVFINDDTLNIVRVRPVVRKRDQSGKAVRTMTLTSLLTARVTGDMMDGRFYDTKADGSGLTTLEFTGKRIPPVPPAPDISKLKFGPPVELFNGKNLDGWTLTDPKQTNGFTVENGVLANKPVQPEGKPRVRFGNLKTTKQFEDFNLKLEVMVPQGSNSGVYLRGIYEVQVADTFGKPLDSHNMGAIYSRITPTVAAEKPAGEWQSLDITLCDRHATVILNGKKIIDNQPVFGVTGGALSADEFVPGPIYLQGDHGAVYYRNLVLTPIVK